MEPVYDHWYGVVPSGNQHEKTVNRKTDLSSDDC